MARAPSDEYASMFAHVEAAGAPTNVTLWYRGDRSLVIRNLQELPPFVRYSRKGDGSVVVETSVDGTEFDVVENANDVSMLSRFLLLDPHSLFLSPREPQEAAHPPLHVTLAEAVFSETPGLWHPDPLLTHRISRPYGAADVLASELESWRAPFVLEGTYRPYRALASILRSPLHVEAEERAPKLTRWFRASFNEGRVREFLQQDNTAGAEAFSTVFHWP